MFYVLLISFCLKRVFFALIESRLKKKTYLTMGTMLQVVRDGCIMEGCEGLSDGSMETGK